MEQSYLDEDEPAQTRDYIDRFWKSRQRALKRVGMPFSVEGERRLAEETLKEMAKETE